MWQICMENAELVESYDFSHLAAPAKIPTKPCTRCGGTGYRRQPPGYYGLCACPSCGGSGKIGKPSNAEVS